MVSRPTATITVNDPDANRNPTSAETLNVGDETVSYPNYQDGYWWFDTLQKVLTLHQEWNKADADIYNRCPGYVGAK